jgi:chondroitin AC lyase
MTTGQEYYNISPVWNWNYIPGTTTPLLDEIPLQKTAFGCFGTSEFAGGATDSIYGVTTYKYFDDYNGINTGANKGYFFFDNEIVCLGSNIRSNYQAVTTVEQCWGEENVSVLYGNSAKEGFSQLSGDVNFEKSVACVIHHGIAYYFPDEGTDVTCNNFEKQGNWYELDTSQKDTIIGGRVFLLAINHKMKDKCIDNYSYIIVPSTDEKNMMSYIKRDDIEIAANTDSIQSVRHRGLGIWEIIFYKGSSFKHNEIEVKTNRPCTMILKQGKHGEFLLHVADPGQTGHDIILDINDKKNDVTYQGFVTYKNTPEIYWGLTQKVVLSKSTPTGINTTKSLHKSENVEGECYVFDMTGKLIMKTLNNSSKMGTWDALKQGMYIIKGSNNMGNSRKILLK